jgi:hypothetical protein
MKIQRNQTPALALGCRGDLVEEEDTGAIISQLEAEIETVDITFIRKMMTKTMIGLLIEEERAEGAVIRKKAENLSCVSLKLISLY